MATHLFAFFIWKGNFRWEGGDLTKSKYDANYSLRQQKW